MEIDNEFRNYIRPLSNEEFEKLEASILSEGIRDPLVIWQGILLDGYHRYKIAQEHGLEYKTVEVELPDRDAAKEWILVNQLGRRNLTEQEASYYRGKLYESRKLNHGGDRKSTGNNFPLKNTADTIGDEYGVTGRTVKNDAQFSKAVDKVAIEIGEEAKQAILLGKAGVPKERVEQLIDIKQKAPEFIEPILKGNIGLQEALKAIKKIEREKEIEETLAEIESNAFTPPSKKYDVIVIDPPWPYGTDYDPDGRRSASPYPEMSLEDIKAIQLPSANDCVLWLWTTHKFMRYSFDILDSWGFRDVAILTWVKNRMGLGSWLRSQSEFCIMAIKGHPKVNLTNQTTVIYGEMREHSRKPDEFYKLVDSLCVGYKIDWFSREKREGWDQYGAEYDKFVGN
jgi:N6-adenosine-specific RNA methylase IME4